MFISDLFESLSRVIYHYTNLHNAVSILSSGEFQLSSTAGSVEDSWAPKGYHYFMSTTRTKFGGFHERTGNGGVMFDLDGNYYNARYKSGPVDYWGQRDASKSQRASESEDRIFSKTPTIPIDGVTSIHVYVKPMDAKDRENWAKGAPGWARKVLLLAKKRGIPAYLYEDEELWRRQDPKGHVEITKRETLTGPDLYKATNNRRRLSRQPNRSFTPWFELINVNSTDKLGERARSFAYDLSYDNPYYSNSLIQSLKTDLSNARKPNSGNDRESAIKLLQWMQKNRLNTVEEAVNFLAKKWKSIKQKEHENRFDESLDEGWRDVAKVGALSAALAGGSAQATDTIPVGQHAVTINNAPVILPDGSQMVVKDGVTQNQILNYLQTKFPDILKNLQANKQEISRLSTRASQSMINAAKEMINTRMGKYLIKVAKLHGLENDELYQFLAQTAHESAKFKKFQEDLDYTAERLMQVFPTAFNAKTAKKYAHRPVQIANRAYANINGNGDEASGDGWKYRGRGFIHLTGRENYERVGRAIGQPLLQNPDLASNPEIAAQVALWFWDHRVVPKTANYSDTTTATKPINKSLAGLTSRHNKFLGLRDVLKGKKS